MIRRKRPKRSKKLETYQICVTIIEAKHLQPKSNPIVLVKVGNRKKKTVVRKNTDNPFYNEYFVFERICSFDTLLSTRIEISVFLRSRFKRSKFHGSISFELATVWDQPDHQYHHKWAMLTNTRDPAAGPRGYVKCNILIHAKDDPPKLPPETDGEDDIEGNLLLPVADASWLGTRQRALYVFTVHRAEALPPGRDGFYVQLSFAGMKGSSSVRSPEEASPCAVSFNERIGFLEMFPALSQRTRVALKRRRALCRKDELLAAFTIHLRDISDPGERGFLPTFGPSFVHLYARDELGAPVYRGRLLLSMRTDIELSEAPGGPRVQREPVGALVEDSFWETREFLLLGIIYDASMIDPSSFPTSRSIAFEANLGEAGDQTGKLSKCRDVDVPGEIKDQSRTPEALLTSLDGVYNWLPLGPSKPCMVVRSTWPDTEYRLLNTNRLCSIADYVEQQLAELEELVAIEAEKSFERYNVLSRELRRRCVAYLKTLPKPDGPKVLATELDRLRMDLCKREIEELLRSVAKSAELKNNRQLRPAMVQAQSHLQNLKKLCRNPQQNFPDVSIWAVSGQNRLACAHIPASRIHHSTDELARGPDCGRIITLFLDRPSSSLPEHLCKLELFLWFGRVEDSGFCWERILPGYLLPSPSSGPGFFPNVFEYQEGSKYQLRAHIFQGRFEPGMDLSGLLDPLVRVIFYGHALSTRVIRQTLDPFWDETLVFPPVEIAGARETIRVDPPRVLLRAYDRDYCNVLELCGSCLAQPLVKLCDETYASPKFPPKLIWHKFEAPQQQEGSTVGAVLAAFEIIEVVDDEVVDVPLKPCSARAYCVPEDIRPAVASYRLEVIFWGVRGLKRSGWRSLGKPKIVVECAGVHVESELLESARKFYNFGEIHAMVNLRMPLEEAYLPPLTIKAYDSQGFGCFKFLGMHAVPSCYPCLQSLVTEREYQAAIYGTGADVRRMAKRKHTAVGDREPERTAGGLMDRGDEKSNFLKRLLGLRCLRAPGPTAVAIRATDKDESHDWWTKYYASLEESKNAERGLDADFQPWTERLPTFVIYTAELEAQPEFGGFQDRLRNFDLRRGKVSGESKYDDKNHAGTFKGFVAIYQWPRPETDKMLTRSGQSVVNGMCTDYPSQEPLRVLVRIYVIKAINLRPSDPLTGKADPYLWLQLGKRNFGDRASYIPNQLNPTFGRVFELEATFPFDHQLKVQVWDFDATSADDLIGETRIDLENRFYSRHRAHCGLARSYDTRGYNAWRDRDRPTSILATLCRRNHLPRPNYLANRLEIGRRVFEYSPTSEDEFDQTLKRERMALSVLHRWKEFPICGHPLVPEHVERRSIFNPRKAGLEQGKLEMWVDLFAIDELPLRPPVNIAPQPPEDYELRVIVWNVEDVPLVDSMFLTGEKCSDIYVKGWILSEFPQRTDIHYNSLTGEGNFNWRFVFRLTWIMNERVMLIRKRTSLVARDLTELKMPCRLTVQVWDSDHFSADDFLGSLTLNLANMPKGSHNPSNCSLKLLSPGSPCINLFRVSRSRAWWPLASSNPAGVLTQAGKIELELELVRAAEADERPAGRGREPPLPLQPPERPDTSFSWFRNPWKACCFVVFRYYRLHLLGGCCCIALVLMLAVAAYAFPNYLVKRLLGA